MLLNLQKLSDYIQKMELKYKDDNIQGDLVELKSILEQLKEVELKLKDKEYIAQLQKKLK